MKKAFLLFAVLIAVVSCSNNNEQVQSLQTRVDSLQNQLNQTYSAGFGEMMTNIQIHHAKLWFAGKNKNWDLAKYEIDELKETFDDIQKYQKARSESEMVPMIIPAIDSVTTTIENENLSQFESSFKYLTNTCNDCHLATGHDYNVIVVPQTMPFTNQKFTPE